MPQDSRLAGSTPFQTGGNTGSILDATGGQDVFTASSSFDSAGQGGTYAPQMSMQPGMTGNASDPMIQQVLGGVIQAMGHMLAGLLSILGSLMSGQGAQQGGQPQGQGQAGQTGQTGQTGSEGTGGAEGSGGNGQCQNSSGSEGAGGAGGAEGSGGNGQCQNSGGSEGAGGAGGAEGSGGNGQCQNSGGSEGTGGAGGTGGAEGSGGNGQCQNSGGSEGTGGAGGATGGEGAGNTSDSASFNDIILDAEASKPRFAVLANPEATIAGKTAFEILAGEDGVVSREDLQALRDTSGETALSTEGGGGDAELTEDDLRILLRRELDAQAFRDQDEGKSGPGETNAFLDTLANDLEIFTMTADSPAELETLNGQQYNGLSSEDITELSRAQNERDESLTDIAHATAARVNADEYNHMELNSDDPSVLSEYVRYRNGEGSEEPVDLLQNGMARRIFTSVTIPERGYSVNGFIQAVQEGPVGQSGVLPPEEIEAFIRTHWDGIAGEDGTLTLEDRNNYLEALESGESTESYTGAGERSEADQHRLDALKEIQITLRDEMDDNVDGETSDSWWNLDELNAALEPGHPSGLFERIVERTGLDPSEVGGPEGIIAGIKRDFASLARVGSNADDLENVTINLADVDGAIAQIEGNNEVAPMDYREVVASGNPAEREGIEALRAALQESDDGNTYQYSINEAGQLVTEGDEEDREIIDLEPQVAGALRQLLNNSDQPGGADDIARLRGDANNTDDNLNDADLNNVIQLLGRGWTLGELAAQGRAGKTFEDLLAMPAIDAEIPTVSSSDSAPPATGNDDDIVFHAMLTGISDRLGDRTLDREALEEEIDALAAERGIQQTDAQRQVFLAKFNDLAAAGTHDNSVNERTVLDAEDLDYAIRYLSIENNAFAGIRGT
ncbi:MAG: hypothetical protein VKJ04_01870 [Vampirovibrionales bacterium]|nr:hypothetical protein [Vampirovibrionales bacterium]